MPDICTITIRGLLPPDLAEQIAQAHALAIRERDNNPTHRVGTSLMSTLEEELPAKEPRPPTRNN